MPAAETASSTNATGVDLNRAATRLAALGQETRLSIYRILIRAMPQGCPVGDVQNRLNIPNSTLSFHLKKLVDVGLVVQERRATTLICRADAAAMDQTIGFLARECCTGNC